MAAEEPAVRPLRMSPNATLPVDGRVLQQSSRPRLLKSVQKPPPQVCASTLPKSRLFARERSGVRLAANYSRSRHVRERREAEHCCGRWRAKVDKCCVQRECPLSRGTELRHFCSQKATGSNKNGSPMATQLTASDRAPAVAKTAQQT